MSESARKHPLEYLVAISALLISTITTGVYLYQAKIMREQQHMSVWPCIQWSISNREGFDLSVNNKGVGPALIRSVAIRLDGKPVAEFSELLNRLLPKERVEKWSRSSWQDRVMSPGESLHLFSIQEQPSAQHFQEALAQHELQIEVHYASVYGEEWVSTGDKVRKL